MKSKFFLFLIIFLNINKVYPQGKKAYVELRIGYFRATYKPDNRNYDFYSCGVTYLRRVFRYSKSRLYFSADLHISREKQDEFYQGSTASFDSEIWLLSFFWGFVNNYGSSNFFYDLGIGVSHINEEVTISTNNKSKRFLFPSVNAFQFKVETGKGFYINKKKSILIVLRCGVNAQIYIREYNRITFEKLEKREWVNILGPKVSLGIIL